MKIAPQPDAGLFFFQNFNPWYITPGFTDFFVFWRYICIPYLSLRILNIKRYKRHIIILLKWLLRFLATIVLLVVLLLIALQFTAVQTYVAQKATQIISRHTNTDISIERLGIRLPKTISLRSLYVEDMQGDTLIYVQKLDVNIRMLALLRNNVYIKEISLSDATINITRLEPDSLFNFDHLLMAFSQGQHESPGEDMQQQYNDEFTDKEAPAPMAFALEVITLQDIRARFADHHAGLDLQLQLGSFQTGFDAIDPMQMLFSLGQTWLSDVNIWLLMHEATPVEKEVKDTPGAMPELGISGLTLERINIALEDENGFSLNTYLSHLETQTRHLDLQTMLFDLEHFMVDGLAAEVTQNHSEVTQNLSGGNRNPSEHTQKTASAQTQPAFHWNKIMPVSLIADDFRLKNISFVLHERPPNSKNGNIQSGNAQIEVTDARFIMNDLLITPDTISGHLLELGGRDAGGLELQSLSGRLALGRGAHIDDLNMETADSRLTASINTTLPVLGLEWPPAPGHLISISLEDGRIGNDISQIVNGLDMLMPQGTDQGIAIELNAAGSLESIKLEKLVVDSDALVRTEITGATIKNLLSPDSLYMDMGNLHLIANPHILSKNLPDGTIPETLQMPRNLELKASIKGFLNDFRFDAEADVDFASLVAGLSMKQLLEESPEWDFSLQLASGAPLAVTGDYELITDLYLSLQAGGTGFDFNTMMADALLVIDSVCFNHYDYKNLEISTSIKEGKVAADIDYEDEHLSLTLKNSVDLSAEHMQVTASWNLKHLNALELGFSDELLALQSKIHADVVLSSDNFFDGIIRIDDLHVLHEREVYSLDSLVIITKSTKSRYTADIHSPLLQASYRGNISPVEVPVSLAAHLNNYLNSNVFSTDTVDKRRHFQFSADVMPSPYLTEIILPQLSSYEPLSISGVFDSDTQIISLDVDVPKIEFMGLQFSGLQIKADSDPDYLDFSLLLPEFHADALSLTNIMANGHLKERKFLFDLSFDDYERQSWLGLSGRIILDDEYTQISFDERMLMNRFFWQVEPDNFIRIGEDHITAKNFRVTAGDKEFAMLSRDISDRLAPLDIRLRNIDLGSFDLLSGSPVVEGIFNGEVSLFNALTRPSFTSDVSVEALGYQGERIGDLRLLVDNPEQGLFLVESTLSGYGNILDIKGLYRQAEEPYIDFSLHLEQLDIATVEALTFDELRNMEGIISGDLEIKGNPSAPDINGSVHFQDVGFLVSFLNVNYHIPDETIRFTKNIISFDDFSLLDRSERRASLDGSINYEDFNEILFDLQLSSSNFLIMDIPRGQNELFYGRLLLDTDINMVGSLSDPVIEGSLKLNEGSSLALFVPQTAPEAIGDEGVVEFISIHDDLFADLLLQPVAPAPIMSTFSNLDMSMNVEIDRQTQVTIIVDEHAGDYLEIRGGGMISFGIDPGGRISLAGRYEITDGAYQMTFYDVIRRNFSIESGSHIIWTGDPLDATVDISAKYSVRTSAAELLATHGTGTGQQEPGFRRQYPFDVFLHMRGELMNPDISFELGLPPEHRGAMDGRIQARLNEVNQHESELNKQVFALLILGSFIQDDPLAAVTGCPGLSTTARTSASRLLSQQLNRLSDRFIRGIDLSFEIESFEEFDNGQVVGRTELQMEVSRDFFDQRLRITAGGHIELEDETRRQLNPADIAGDLSVEYLLLPDGRLIVKVYRERNYQDIYDGELVETGISLIFRQTFNTFREIFRRKDDETGDNNEVNLF